MNAESIRRGLGRWILSGGLLLGAVGGGGFAAEPLSEPVEGSKVADLAFSSDGEFLTTYNNRDLILWDTGSWKPLWKIERESGSYDGLRFSPDDSLIAEGDGKQLLIRDAKDGAVRQRIVELEVSQKLHHHIDVRSARFSPDGKYIAMTADMPWVSGAYRPMIWEVATGELRNPLLESDAEANKERWPRQALHSFAFSPDSKTIAAGDAHGKLMFWEIGGDPWPSGVSENREDLAHIQHVAFSPGGQQLVAGGSSRNGAFFYRVVGPGHIEGFPLEPNIQRTAGLAYAADGSFFATLSTTRKPVPGVTPP